MDKYAVPIAGFVRESGSWTIDPELRIIVASDPKEALKLCKVVLHDEEVAKNMEHGDTPEEAESGWAEMIWHYEDHENIDEEGWLMGDPVKI